MGSSVACHRRTDPGWRARPKCLSQTIGFGSICVRFKVMCRKQHPLPSPLPQGEGWGEGGGLGAHIALNRAHSIPLCAIDHGIAAWPVSVSRVTTQKLRVLFGGYQGECIEFSIRPCGLGLVVFAGCPGGRRGLGVAQRGGACGSGGSSCRPAGRRGQHRQAHAR